MKREGLAMYTGALALGLEGVVAKDAKSPYFEGLAENRFWLKIKNKNFKRKEPVEFRQKKSRCRISLRLCTEQDGSTGQLCCSLMIIGSLGSKGARPFLHQRSPSWHSAMLPDAQLLRSLSIATAAR